MCTGSLVLGAAGLLDGRRATTCWLALDAGSPHKAPAHLTQLFRDNSRFILEG